MCQQQTFLAYFELYCDINELDTPQLIWCAQQYMNYQDKNLVTFSKRWWLFRAFSELTHNKRELETFMILGDITSRESIRPDDCAHHALEQITFLLESNENALSKCFILLDRTVLLYNDQTLVDEVRQQIENRSSILFMI